MTRFVLFLQARWETADMAHRQAIELQRVRLELAACKDRLRRQQVELDLLHRRNAS